MKNFTPATALSMRTESTITEKWIQGLIEKDPSILGLGDDLQFLDSERKQPGAGRLDLLLRDEEDEPGEPTNRAYWETKAAKDTVGLVDRLLKHINGLLGTSLELTFNKHYIGISREKQPFNFAVFRPKKKAVTLEIKLPRTEVIDQDLDNSAFDLLSYDKHFGYYRLSLTPADVEQFDDLLQQLLRDAYKRRGG